MCVFTLKGSCVWPKVLCKWRLRRIPTITNCYFSSFCHTRHYVSTLIPCTLKCGEVILRATQINNFHFNSYIFFSMCIRKNIELLCPTFDFMHDDNNSLHLVSFYQVSGIALSTLYTIVHSVFTLALGGRSCYYNPLLQMRAQRLREVK